jgi:hypothetical protein
MSKENIKLAINNTQPSHGILPEPLIPAELQESEYPAELFGEKLEKTIIAMSNLAQAPRSIAGQSILSALP